MKITHLFSMAFFCSLLTFSQLSFSQRTIIHVSVDGDNKKGDGTIEKPFATLKRAITKAVKLDKNKPCEIQIHAGEYYIDDTIFLGQGVIGKRSKNLTIRSASDEKVTFFGGKKVPFEAFKPLKDKAFIKNLVDAKAKRKILVADLKALGIKDFGQLSRHGWMMEPKTRVPASHLIIGNQRMTLARWPNKEEDSKYMVYKHYLPEQRPLKGYEIRVQELIDNVKLLGEVTYQKVIDSGDRFDKTKNYDGKGGTVQVAFDRMKHWQDIENIYLDGVLSSTWEWTYNRLSSVDTEKKTITFASPELRGVGVGESVRLPHFHFDNIAEEIDSEGEYYIDRKKGLLYLYPPKDFNESQPIVISTINKPMVYMNKSGSVKFEGIHFECGRDVAFSVNNCFNVEINNCTVSNFVKGGIYMTGRNLSVRNSHIHGIGAYGVHIAGGNFKTLKSANNEVVNCHIHDFGWDQKSQMPGVMVDGVAPRVANCEIYDGTHFAIRVLRTNDAVIEYNEIYDLPKYHHFDGGAVYHISGANPEKRGNVFRYNYLHDIPTIGIYSDNYTWGEKIYGNVFYRVGIKANRPAIMVNGGGECETYHNIAIDSPLLYGQGARPKSPSWMPKWQKAIDKYGNGKVLNTPYKKYPDFLEWLKKTEPEEFYRPKSYLYDNVYFHPNVAIYRLGGKTGVNDKSKHLDSKGNLITTTDPGFVDWQNKNFYLKKNAEVFKQIKGFPTLPIKKMGRQKKTPL